MALKRNIGEIEPVSDTCGSVYELYNSKSMSLAKAVMEKDSEPHRHMEMEEVYFILRGRAKMRTGNTAFEIAEGDVVFIPKGRCHQIFDIREKIELVVASSPGFDREDAISCGHSNFRQFV